MHMTHTRQRIQRDQRGITGLETAIIMISFVVVASVFAYTVLSAGLFSSEKGKDAIYTGIDNARSTMTLSGSVVAKDTNNDDDINEIVFILSNGLGGEGINMTTTTDTDDDGLLSDESTLTHTTIISYFDSSQEVTDLAWTRSEVGKGDSDNVLEDNEKFEITVNVANLSPRLEEEDTFILEIKPRDGASLIFERTTPVSIDKVNDLK
jgi:archaeal flagellin FlaB